MIKSRRAPIGADSEDGHGGHSQQQREDRERQEQEPVDSLCNILPRHARVVDGRRAQTSVHHNLANCSRTAVFTAWGVVVPVVEIKLLDAPCIGRMFLIKIVQVLKWPWVRGWAGSRENNGGWLVCFHWQYIFQAEFDTNKATNLMLFLLVTNCEDDQGQPCQ